MRRWAVYCFLGIIALLALEMAYFYAIEDWRGSREWNEYLKQLSVKGETVELRKLDPPGDPANDLSKVAIFADFYQKPEPKSPRLRQIDVGFGTNDTSSLPKLGGYLKGNPLDLAAWQKLYRSKPDLDLTNSMATSADDVLAALENFAPAMRQVDEAVSRPGAFFPTDYKMPYGQPLGSATSLINVAKVLHLEGVAHLENGRNDLAETNFENSFHLDLPLARRCTMVDCLVLIGIRAIDNGILWEGLHRHAWTDTQLHKMDSDLASLNILGLGQQAMRVERASGLQVIQYVQDGHANQLADITHNDDFYGQFGALELLVFLKIRPSGWYDHERLYLAANSQAAIDSINVSSGTINPSVFNNWPDLNVSDASWKVNHVMSAMLLIPYRRFGDNVANAETHCRLARLACRLEEYRLAHGKYPDQLEQLPDLPPHLDQEVVNESPFHYRLEGDRYVLYSVGWSEIDQNGISDSNPQKGNWPWPCP